MAERITKWKTADGREWDREEDARAHEAANFVLPAEYRKADRVWTVTTEGDCEGRSVRKLGIYKGHLTDIAAFLSDKVYYALQFEPIDPIAIQPSINDITSPQGAARPMSNGVDVSLGIQSRTWDFKPELRAQVFDKTYGTPLYGFTRGTSYATAKMVRKK